MNDFRDEDLVLNIEGLNVEDGCYTWYMSVKDKVAERQEDTHTPVMRECNQRDTAMALASR